MRWVHRFLACVAIGSLLGCTRPPGEESPASQDQVQIVGTLTDDGIACPALRAADGNLYTLTPGDWQTSFTVGDVVCVRGTIAAVGVCQQGTTIAVETVTLAADCLPAVREIGAAGG